MLTFVETPFFTKQIVDLVDDDDYGEFQHDLLENPCRGPLLVGCSGLRKVRMALPGRGKRGGARVIYLYVSEAKTIILLYLFKKSDSENISKAQRNQLGRLAEQIKEAYGSKKRNS